MSVSVFELFSVGIGPSSSHTVGPMRAARRFVVRLGKNQLVQSVTRVKVELFGSLGWTGKGHGSDKAVLSGLEGEEPETVNPDQVFERYDAIHGGEPLELMGFHLIKFRVKTDLIFHKRKTLDKHPNGMRFHAYDADGECVLTREYYSVGGGFVVHKDDDDESPVYHDGKSVPFAFTSGEELLEACKSVGGGISDVMMANETVLRSPGDIREGLMNLWHVMKACVERGCSQEGVLPGGLKVRRRAAAMHRALASSSSTHDPLAAMDWVNLYALAVNEENAGGGRVVTAPTNGAAGIIPAVLHYYRFHQPGATDEGIIRFLLASGAIGSLYKMNASISGAEVGCQGEVGVACSMAAAGLAEALGGTPAQVENAAEIGMEHNLGLTCDPVGGLVQVPCIERNAMGAIKAINAARLALRGDGTHKVSLDKVIKTMWDTGADMKSKYKETSRGGLAVNIIEC